jgi:hypothetical protein
MKLTAITLAFVALSFPALSQAQADIEPRLLYKVHGDPEAGDFGAAIAGLGDMNRDGIGDFAVTAYVSIWTDTDLKAWDPLFDERSPVPVVNE